MIVVLRFLFLVYEFVCFFFKQKTAYEMRISDWSSDVCSSDLVRFALERLLYRLSLSPYRDRYVLKGGMLVTLWLEGGARETRDADFLGFGEADEETLKQIFAEIMAVPAKDGLVFDTDALIATAIRVDMEYGGSRLRKSAYHERTRIPVDRKSVGWGKRGAVRED